ncbi:unnamed protein product, partial [Prorocentrum cordatum]
EAPASVAVLSADGGASLATTSLATGYGSMEPGCVAAAPRPEVLRLDSCASLSALTAAAATGEDTFVISTDQVGTSARQGIGKGSFGEVFRGRWRGRDVAVREVRSDEVKGVPRYDTTARRLTETLMNITEGTPNSGTFVWYVSEKRLSEHEQQLETIWMGSLRVYGTCVSVREDVRRPERVFDLSATNLGHIATKRGMADAPASVDHAHSDQTVLNMYTAGDAHIMMPRRRRTGCVVNAHDGEGTYHNKVGCSMGDSDAGTKFRNAFEQPTQEWRKALFSSSAVRELTAGCPVTQKTSDLGVRKWKVTAICAEAVWQKIKVAPPGVEIVAPGLRRYQALARNPHRRAQEFAAAFGKVAFENVAPQQFPWAPACTPTVTPTDKTNPWALQFKNVANGGGGSQGQKKKDPKIVDLSELDSCACDVKQMQMFFPVMMRLILNLAMRQRQKHSIELKTFLVSSGVQVAAKAMARVRAWVRTAEEARATLSKEDAEKKTRELGTISVACCAGVLEDAMAEGNAMGGAVPLAKITDAHGEGEARLALSFASRLNFAPVLASLVQAGAEHKQGAAPMGHLERLMHAGLQELENMMQE